MMDISTHFLIYRWTDMRYLRNYYTDTPSCKTLGGSAELAADPAKFCLAHRQMRAKGILRYIDIE